MPVPEQKSPDAEKQAFKNETNNIAGDVKQSASQTGQRFAAEFESARDRAKKDAAFAIKEAQRQAADAVRERKNAAAQYTRDAASAVHDAADSLTEQEDDALAGYINGFADQIDRVGSYIEERELDEIADDTRNVARRYPALFFGGLFVAGLAVGRVLRASENHRPFDLNPEPQPSGTAAVPPPSQQGGFPSPAARPNTGSASMPSNPPTAPGSINTGPQLAGPGSPSTSGSNSRPDRPDVPGRGPDHLTQY